MTKFSKTLAGVAFAVALTASGAFAAITPGALPSGWVGAGGFGTGTPDGDVTAPPTTGTSFQYVTTNGGLGGVGALPGVGGSGTPINGSTVTTSTFSADAGDELEFFFNYVTSDGSGFADYSLGAASR